MIGWCKDRSYKSHKYWKINQLNSPGLPIATGQFVNVYEKSLIFNRLVVEVAEDAAKSGRIDEKR